MSGFEGKPVTKESVKGSQKSDSAAADTKNVKEKIAHTGGGHSETHKAPNSPHK